MIRTRLSAAIQQHGGTSSVAKAAKLSTGALWQYKNSSRIPRFDTGVRLAAVLDMSADELVDVLLEELVDDVVFITVRRKPELAEKYDE